MDLWQASQRGNFQRVVFLIESGTNAVTDRDTGNVTALHWAAINNHVSVARFLLDRGAEIDAVGGNSSLSLGDLVATPFHWAARSGHTQMVTLLYKRNANLYKKDSQGYNALHLAVHAGHSMMIVYLLAIGMEVDTRDTMQRTPLMWSAYQGNSLEGMNEILRNNPNLDTVDVTGYTALHWAVISGHLEFAKKLLEEGASHTVKDPEGKTAGDWAEERQTGELYRSILAEAKSAKTQVKQSKDSRANQIIYSMPYLLLPYAFLVLAKFAIYFALPLLFGSIYYLNKFYIVGRLLNGDSSLLPTTPFTSSICHATLFYVLLTWLRILPSWMG
jgi:palmitoyltransferase